MEAHIAVEHNPVDALAFWEAYIVELASAVEVVSGGFSAEQDALTSSVYTLPAALFLPPLFQDGHKGIL